LGDALDKRTLQKALSAIPHCEMSSFKILDIPCGTGRMIKFLNQQDKCVTGADISKEMMNIAKKKTSNTNSSPDFYQVDAVSLPFKDNAFDAIISIRFMGHIPKGTRIKILSEFGRISKNAIVEYSLKTKTVKIRQAIEKTLKTGSGLSRRWEWHTFEKNDLFKEIKEAGLKVINMWAKLPYLSDSYYFLMQREIEDN
jgi:ubiquinone/menaquinone biosynthesis C-methylase UbiE